MHHQYSTHAPSTQHPCTINTAPIRHQHSTHTPSTQHRAVSPRTAPAAGSQHLAVEEDHAGAVVELARVRVGHHARHVREAAGVSVGGADTTVGAADDEWPVAIHTTD